jgi:hypothetical protein
MEDWKSAVSHAKKWKLITGQEIILKEGIEYAIIKFGGEHSDNNFSSDSDSAISD